MSKMTGLRFAIVFCVFLIQRAASQNYNCQSEIYISIDDLINALNNGPGIPGLTSQGCGCQASQQSEGNQQSCGCNQPSLPQPSIAISQPSQCGCNRPTGQQCGCNQQISLGQPCGCNQQISFGQPCGCSQPSINQPSLSISSLPLSFGSQQSCNQPITVTSPPVTLNLQSGNSNQQCGCNQQSLTIGNQCGCNQQSLTIGNQCGRNQPSITIGNQQCGCNQQSLTIGNQQCGCNQPSLSISNQQSSCNQPSQVRQPISFQPISLVNQVSSVSQGCQGQSNNQVAISDYESVAIVPSALLQAPPYGIFFAGDNLLIDGAVQVCGNLPFNSVIELGGVVPTTGSGCVQYVCGDLCA